MKYNHGQEIEKLSKGLAELVRERETSKEYNFDCRGKREVEIWNREELHGQLTDGIDEI